MIECEICGLKMRNRINGSHLTAKHGISLQQYLEAFPDADVGTYKVSKFNCKVCNDSIDNNSAIKNKHLGEHNLTIDDYNVKFNVKKCECGCGEDATYSFATHKFNRFKSGHYTSWNKGLTKETHPGLKSQSEYMVNNNPMHNHESVVKNVNNQVCDSDRVERMKAAYKDTMLRKYGVDNAFKSKEIKGKIRSTNLKKYGVENPQQCAEIHEKNVKNRLNWKSYKLPSGQIIQIQGYEGYALDLLLEKYNENDIITKRAEMPEIWYSDTKKHRYFPDIFIPSERRFIEVKSTWTYSDKTKELVDRKCKAVIDLGYEISVWVMNKETLLKEITYE